jgi:putative acetyltransferase
MGARSRFGEKAQNRRFPDRKLRILRVAGGTIREMRNGKAVVEIVRVSEESGDFLRLVKLLDAELAIRDGEERGFYAQFNTPVGLGGVIVASLDGEAVGCGAFKRYDDGVAEIKRMFVQPEARGNRIAASVLKELEKWAAEAGFRECILETGYKQPEAIALYKREGYEVIPNYGQYAGVENSVCMRKVIAPG